MLYFFVAFVIIASIFICSMLYNLCLCGHDECIDHESIRSSPSLTPHSTRWSGHNGSSDEGHDSRSTSWGGNDISNGGFDSGCSGNGGYSGGGDSGRGDGGGADSIRASKKHKADYINYSCSYSYLS